MKGDNSVLLECYPKFTTTSSTTYKQHSDMIDNQNFFNTSFILNDGIKIILMSLFLLYNIILSLNDIGYEYLCISFFKFEINILSIHLVSKGL